MRSLCVTRLLLCSLLVLLALNSRAADPVPDDFKCGPIDCDVLKNDPEARFRAIVKDMNDGKDLDETLQRIDEYRAVFWATYPNGPGHLEAREKLAEALYLKDMFYLQANLVFRILDSDNKDIMRKGQEQSVNDAMALFGMAIDDGIPKLAQYEFYKWVTASVERIGPAKRTDDIFEKGLKVGLGVLSDTFRKGANPSGKEYQEYIMQRDWAEFDRAKVIPAGFDSPEGYGLYLYVREGQIPFAEASRIYAGMMQVLGQEVVQRSAAEVRKAPRTQNGNLVTNVPRPVKKGPGGDEVDDNDVPFPPGVIGVYSNPLVAMEVLATSDDDRRYLLYVLKGQFIAHRNWLREYTTKWIFAENAYLTLVHAFGEKQVLETAHALRLAPKRLTDGTVINQEALGATRQEPFAVLCDLLARKDPRGYVKQMLGFSQNFVEPHTVDLDSAFTKFIEESKSDESAIVKAATAMAADRPNLVSHHEIDTLKKVLNGSLSLDKPVLHLVDYPLYTDWKRFAPDTQVWYATRDWIQDVPGTDHVAPRRWLSSRTAFTLQAVTPDAVKLWRTSQVFDSRGTPHPPRDLEIAYPAKFRPPQGWAGALCDTQLRRMTRPASADSARETGKETLVICGRQIATTCICDEVSAPGEIIITRIWTSPEVPTGLVRMLEERIALSPDGRRPGTRYVSETYLESFKGLSPGSATATDVPLAGPGGLSPELAKQSRLKPSPQAAVAPQATPQQPGAQQKDPRIAEQEALGESYRALLKRAGNAGAELDRRERVYQTKFPSDIQKARARLAKDLDFMIGVMGTGDRKQIDPAMKKLDETMNVVEKYLKDNPK